MDLGQGIKTRTFGPTEQGNVWENEKETGEPGAGLRKDWYKERLKVSQKRVDERHMFTLPKAEESYHIFAVSNACKTLLQFLHPDLVHLESYNLLLLYCATTVLLYCITIVLGLFNGRCLYGRCNCSW